MGGKVVHACDHSHGDTARIGQPNGYPAERLGQCVDGGTGAVGKPQDVDLVGRSQRHPPEAGAIAAPEEHAWRSRVGAAQMHPAGFAQRDPEAEGAGEGLGADEVRLLELQPGDVGHPDHRIRGPAWVFAATRTALGMQPLVSVGSPLDIDHDRHRLCSDEIVTYERLVSQGLLDEFVRTDCIAKLWCVDEVEPSRVERRKMRTRAALVRAAQGFIAEGKTSVPVLEITQAADVGMGSFYNHFQSKEELFDAALTDVLDAVGVVLDTYTATITDPAEAFATSFRLACRLFRHRPQEARMLLANGSALIFSDRGLAPRALRDITAGITKGRFTIDDPELGLAIAGGALFGLGNLLREQPDRDDGAAADEVTQSVLRIFGMTPKQARAVCARPLPDLSSLS